MALLDGKQLRDESLSLDKLQGTSGLVTFTSSATMSFGAGTSLTTDDTNIVGGLDVVNKNYVDSVVAGLNPKESSRVIYNGDVTSITGYTYSNGVSGVGATLTFTASGLSSIDSVSLSSGDRVIINSSTDQFVNGVYVYGTTASFFTRASDFDGSTSQEVDGGEYSFVTEGTLNADTGWVVSSPNTTATIGVTPIIWTQFSAAGVILAGDGLFQTGNSFNVGAGTGLTTSANLVSLLDTTVTPASYGGAGTIPTYTVNAQGQLTTASDVTIDISSSQVNDFTTASETAIFTTGNFVDGTTVNFTVTAGDSVTAEVITGSLTASHLNSNSQGATAGYILSANADGTFAWIINDAGDITEVTAGVGLTGGGTTGAITLDVRAENGLTVDGTSDAVELGGTLTKNTTIDGAEFDLTIGNADYILFTASSAFDVETNFVSLDSGTGSVQILSGGDTTVSAGGDVDLLAVNDINISSDDNISISFGSGNNTESGLVTDGSGNGYGLQYTADYSSTFLTYSLVTKAYVDSAVGSAGTITEITAGDGLIGGGTVGNVTIDVNTGAGITISSDAIAIDLATNSGLNTTSGLSIDPSVAGTGLTFSAGVLSVVAGSAQPVYQAATSINQNAPNANNFNTNITITSTPNDYSRVNVFVNGQMQRIGDGVTTTDCYFGTQSGSAVTISNIQSGYTLFWNGIIAGFRIRATDQVDIQYEV